MPRTTKDSEKEELNKKKSTTKKSTTATKKTTSTKATTAAKKKKADEVKPATKITKSKPKKEAEEKVTKTTTKKVATTKKKTTSKATSEKKKTTKKATSTKSTTASKKTASTKTAATKEKTATSSAKKKSTTTATKKKTTTSATRKKSNVKKLEEAIIAEYYDLPYRYNETVVKILYQTPTILFVYWDISDEDKANYIKQYGENFFNNTKPILKISNITKDYYFEVEINDYANSWYINVNDANCEYRVELIRRTIKYEENLNTDYIYVSSSNEIEFPNDHILLDELPDKIRFKNVKTNQISTKDISTLHLIGFNKIYNVYDFYQTFYKDEIEENNICNPSSSSWR